MKIHILSGEKEIAIDLETDLAGSVRNRSGLVLVGIGILLWEKTCQLCLMNRSIASPL
jgi:hypothetical protein